jgi:hypothetical protein
LADIQAKLKELLDELVVVSVRELHLARWSHWMNVSAMVGTLVTTAIAVVLWIHAEKLLPDNRAAGSAARRHSFTRYVSEAAGEMQLTLQKAQCGRCSNPRNQD